MEIRLRFWPSSDRQGLTALLEDIQTGVCDVVVFYIFVILSFLAECSNEDGIILRGDEGDSVEMDKCRHGRGFDDDDQRADPRQPVPSNLYESSYYIVYVGS